MKAQAVTRPRKNPINRALLCAIWAILIFGFTSSALAWTNGQNATYVIGQADFTHNTSSAGATGLRNPRSVAIDTVHSKLYVADRDNNRVLRYAYPITGNQPAAELVFGQPDFDTTTTPVSAGRNTISAPTRLIVDQTGRLWVSSSGDHRVIWFNAAHLVSANQPDADGVLGQPDFVSNTPDVTANRMNTPLGVTIDQDGTLFVADTFNHRVLRFDNAASKANGADADGVLGQADFTSNGTGVTATTMEKPIGLCLMGTTLFVGDRSNGRILRFDDAAQKANGAAADGVLGQPDLTTRNLLITQDGMEYAGSVTIDSSGNLYATDGFNADRVLIFSDVLSKADGANADFVLGHADFTSSGSGLGQDRLNMDSHGGGLSMDSARGYLFVVDDNNNRVMVFKNDISGPRFTLKVEEAYFPSGATLDFGVPGTSMMFTIENPGNADLVLGGSPMVNVSGEDAASFVVTQPTSPVAPAGSATFTIEFAPVYPGLNSATISIDSNDTGNTPFTLDLTGNVSTAFALTIAKEGTGSGTVTSSPDGIACGDTCTYDFAESALITLTATAASGSVFTGWTGGGCTGTDTCQVSLDDALTVTANFAEQTSVSSGGGSSGCFIQSLGPDF